MTTLLAVWSILVGAAALSAVAVLPYASAKSGRMPSAAAMLRTLALALALFGAIAAIGLACGHELGLGAPILEALARGDRPAGTMALPLWCILGAALAGVLWLIDVGLFAAARAPLQGGRVPVRPLLHRFGALLYGAVAEEVLMRLGLLSVIAFVLWRLMRRVAWPIDLALAGAVALSAAVFAAGHLQSIARLVPLTRGLVLRAVVLNGLAGLVFGALYVGQGIEAAMAAHAGTDLVVVILLPSLAERGRKRSACPSR